MVFCISMSRSRSHGVLQSLFFLRNTSHSYSLLTLLILYLIIHHVIMTNSVTLKISKVSNVSLSFYQPTFPCYAVKMQHSFIFMFLNLCIKMQLMPLALLSHIHGLFYFHYKCLKRLPDESKADETMVISLWRHEIMRIMRDRISRSTDLLWFDDKLHQVFSQVFTLYANQFQLDQ